MVLDIEHLKVSIGAFPVLHDVSLTLGPGEIYGLLGPNGAGKSTTIAAALGLHKASRGRVQLFGRDPAQPPDAVRARVGVLPEHNGFYEWMTADAYLAYFAALYGMRHSAKQLAARLESVGLRPRAGQTIGTYSRGMRQRLGLARALIADPRLIILDEPTNGLDPRGRREIHDMLLALAARGAAVLICTHLLDDVERLCARVGFIVQGRTVAEGEISELLRERGEGRQFRLRLRGSAPIKGAVSGSPVTVVGREGEWVRVGVDAQRDPEDVWRELMFSGWPIVEIESIGGALEDLYLDLTKSSEEPERRVA